MALKKSEKKNVPHVQQSFPDGVTWNVRGSAIKFHYGNAGVQWNNIKECVLGTISDLVGKVEKRARKPWITQEMISKMDERRNWKNVNIEKGRRNYRRLRNELKRATENAKKEYFENM